MYDACCSFIDFHVSTSILVSNQRRFAVCPCKVTHYRLRAVAARRKIASAILLLYRLVAAALLLYVGTNFLVYTVNVTELILNAVALGIILDIDDLLFDAMATTPGRHLVHQLDPLHMPSLPRIRGADAKSVFMSLFIPGLTILVYYSMLEPFVGTLSSVKDAMCGGNQQFVWTLDKRRITQLSPTYGGGWEEEEGSIKKLGRKTKKNTTKYDESDENLNETFSGWITSVAKHLETRSGDGYLQKSSGFLSIYF